MHIAYALTDVTVCYNCYYRRIEKTTSRSKLCSDSHIVKILESVIHATLLSRLHYSISRLVLETTSYGSHSDLIEPNYVCHKCVET